MKNILAFLLLISLTGCIEPFEPDVDVGTRHLMVNGLITNEPGPYKVMVNRTTLYGSHFSIIDQSVWGATVTISDETGTAEVLKEIRPGEFHTSATGIRGRVGGIYTLKVRLKDGQEFVSEPEKLNPVPPIDRLYYQLKEISYIDENNNEQRTPYFELQVDVQDPPGERNYYKWVSEGTYEVETQPEDFKMQDRLGNDIPSPKSCCRQCWIGRKDLSVKVVSDKQFDGNKMVGKAVGTISVTPRYMGIKYHVNLQQHSLSQNAFEFWSMLEKQAVGTGSLQDAAPANAWGNMYKVQKPDERVLGYFGASAIARKEGWFQRSDVPFFLPRFVYPDDCRAIPGATTTRPPFWQ